MKVIIQTVRAATLDSRPRIQKEADDIWTIYVPEVEDFKSCATQMIQELALALLAEDRGINPESIEKWQLGDQRSPCLFQREKTTAENLARMFAAVVDIDWADHENEQKGSFRGP